MNMERQRASWVRIEKLVTGNGEKDVAWNMERGRASIVSYETKIAMIKNKTQGCYFGLLSTACHVATLA